MERLLEEVVLGTGREILPSHSEEILASRHRFPQVSAGQSNLAHRLKMEGIPQSVNENQTNDKNSRVDVDRAPSRDLQAPVEEFEGGRNGRIYEELREIDCKPRDDERRDA